MNNKSIFTLWASSWLSLLISLFIFGPCPTPGWLGAFLSLTLTRGYVFIDFRERERERQSEGGRVGGEREIDREGRRVGREWERERTSIWERNIDQLPPTTRSAWLGFKSTIYMPWQGIEPTAFSCTDWHSNQTSQPARAAVSVLQHHGESSLALYNHRTDFEKLRIFSHLILGTLKFLLRHRKYHLFFHLL